MRKRIFNTGRGLPKAGIGDWLELQSKRDLLVKQPIMRQSRRDGSVIYGGHALNRLLGRGLQRSTYDYDVYSGMPKKHAVQLERSIDRGTNSDLAYVERTSYPHGRIMKPLFRVKTRVTDSVEVDYNTMPSDISYVVRDRGVRFESLTRARDKYRAMNRQVGLSRTAFGELERIRIYNLIKKYKR